MAADRLAQHSRELQLKLQTDAAAKEKAKADIAARKKVLEAEAAAATLAQAHSISAYREWLYIRFSLLLSV